MQSNKLARADGPLDHRKLLGFRNLADVTSARDAFEEAADHLFQKRGGEQKADPEADATLDHRKLFGFRNLAEVAAREQFGEAGDDLFQKRGDEAPAP